MIASGVRNSCDAIGDEISLQQRQSLLLDELFLQQFRLRRQCVSILREVNRIVAENDHGARHLTDFVVPPRAEHFDAGFTRGKPVHACGKIDERRRKWIA